jgi:hypothetical protein
MKSCFRTAAAALVLAAALMSVAVSAGAAERLLQLALINPAQLFPEEDSVAGFRLNLIYGKNVSVTGLDIGLVNHTGSGVMTGVQYGVVGITDHDLVGWQYNSINVTRNFCKGMQWGLVNYARSMKGFQLGIVNYTWNMEGIQIGLINVIREGAAVPLLPLINWSF